MQGMITDENLFRRVDSDYPYPIAALFRQLRTQRTDTDRWENCMNLLDGVLHFLGAASLAAYRDIPPTAKAQQHLRRLQSKAHSD